MEMHSMVRPEHLNHHGHLFGGKLLSWVDENAWIAATKDFPTCTLVTRAIDQIEFTNPIYCGSILRFEVSLIKKGSTSLRYSVIVYATPVGTAVEEKVFSNYITFVNIDDVGNKKEIP